MRISYTEEEDYQGQFALWRANVGRSLAGARGQAALRDLEAALLALPEKRLIQNHLARKGEVCTTGALVLQRKMSLGQAREQALAELEREAGTSECWECYHPASAHLESGCSACAIRVEEQASLPEAKRYWTVCPAYEQAPEDEPGVEGSTEDSAIAVGVPRLVAWRLVELNDIELDYLTPEDRYTRVLAWTQSRLRNPAPEMF